MLPAAFCCACQGCFLVTSSIKIKKPTFAQGSRMVSEHINVAFFFYKNTRRAKWGMTLQRDGQDGSTCETPAWNSPWHFMGKWNFWQGCGTQALNPTGRHLSSFDLDKGSCGQCKYPQLFDPYSGLRIHALKQVCALFQYLACQDYPSPPAVGWRC